MEFGLKKVTVKKKTMSVPEMKTLLGLGKTESYYLLKKGFFKVLTIDGHLRVDIQSFEEWYDNQWHYQKVNGPPPGINLCQYMTVKDVGIALGIKAGDADWVVRESGRFKLYKVNGLFCILRSDFEEWYQRQFRNKKITGEPPGTAFPPSYSGQEISDILGIPLRNSVYELTSQNLFHSEVIDGQLRVDKASFERWLATQTKYKR